MKKVLGTLPTILPPCWDEDFYINPSVGMDSIGAVLMQKDPKTSLIRPNYFTSRVMKESEKNFTFVENMVLALMFATEHFCSYLLSQHFVIITMEGSFPYVLQHIDGSSRISKWIT